MSVVPRSPEGRDEALVALGDQLAACLLSGDGGSPGRPIGWRGLLQAAADLTENDPGVLRLADEIYQAAAEFQRREFVRGYATATLFVLDEGAGCWILRGMLAHLADDDHSAESNGHL